MRDYLIEEMFEQDFEEGDYEIALVPVGSTESHGSHLPFAQDTFTAYELCKLVAERTEGTFIIPPLFYGMSEHYQHQPFSISLRPQNLIAVLDDVFRSIYRHGVKKMLVINGHDGNVAPIEVASREFKVNNEDAVIAVLNEWWSLAGELLPDDTFEVWEGLGHGGEGETSIALHLYPERVNMEEARGVVPDLPENVEIKWDFKELTPYGATGDPTKATKEKGEKMTEVLVDALVDFLQEMDERDWDYRWKGNK